MNINDLAIDLASDDPSVAYPQCILWATVR